MDLDFITGIEELKSKVRVRLILVLALVSPFIFIIIVAFIPWQATFSVNAKTGYVEILTTKTQKSWVIEDVNMFVNGIDNKKVDGVLTVASNVKMSFQSLFKGGTYLQIDSTNSPANSIVIATFENYKTGNKTTIKEGLELVFPNKLDGIGYILPIEGQWKIGNVLHSQSVIDNPILTEGKIQIFGDALFRDNRFQAMTAQLEPGDQMYLNNGNNIPVDGYGFVGIQDSHQITIQYHAEADKAVIERLGSEGYSVGPSFWNRISKDPILKIVSGFVSTWTPIILFMMLMYTRLKTPVHIKSKRKSKKKKK